MEVKEIPFWLAGNIGIRQGRVLQFLHSHKGGAWERLVRPTKSISSASWIQGTTPTLTPTNDHYTENRLHFLIRCKIVNESLFLLSIPTYMDNLIGPFTNKL